MLPMDSSRRRLLYQSTHSRVANSTLSKERHGPRRYITSALKRPMTVSARALSYESPTLPTDGSIPASARRSVYLIDTYWTDSNGRRNTLKEEVAMSIRKRRSDRSGRAPLPSPGRPPVAGRDEGRRFWLAIATGMSSEDAAVEAGVSQPVGYRWFRKAGGMPPAMFRSSAKPLSGRYLSLVEREEIALLRVQGHSMQEIGRRLGRSASTISRELRRNAATRSGGLEYRATTAQWHAERSARRPKPTKLALNATLRTYVEDRLAGVVVAASGVPIPGPAVSWKGRRQELSGISCGATTMIWKETSHGTPQGPPHSRPPARSAAGRR